MKRRMKLRATKSRTISATTHPTPNPLSPRKNTKVTGELSEAAFLTRAAHRGFGVAKPWGDSRRYDFILDNGTHLLRVQIKCTECIRAQAYETRATYTTGKARAVYTKQDIDFIAAHVVPLDTWYIIPVEICTPQPMLRFYPHRQAKKMRLEPYREAWHLLESQPETGKDTSAVTRKPPGKVTKAETAAIINPAIIELQARADETIYPNTVVILSEASASRSEADAQSKDPYTSSALPDSETKHTTPVSLPQSAAPWPIPPLTILVTRKGKQILADRPS
jgi:PD-(D/E)XK endonuclease